VKNLKILEPTEGEEASLEGGEIPAEGGEAPDETN
jgi:hypothetical protein